tara:strand:- start:23545 stop:24450 length:906 start_codon:yes stop_codon:yes gene_type:complete
MNNSNENKDVELIEFFSLLWSKRITLSLITLLITTLAASYAIFSPNIYSSSAILKVSDSQDGSTLSSITSQYGDLASMAGISLPVSSQDKTGLVIQTVKSRDFLKHLILNHDVLSKLMATKKYDHKSQKIVFDTSIYDPKKEEWNSGAPSYLRAYREYFSKNLSINLDRNTGFIKITFYHESPNFAKEFLEIIISELNATTKLKDLEESQLALKYLESQLEITNQNDIRDSINKLIEIQLKKQMFANIKDDYLVSVIDQPFAPEEKSSPRRALITILGLFIGFVLSIFIVLFKNSFQNRNV